MHKELKEVIGGEKDDFHMSVPHHNLRPYDIHVFHPASRAASRDCNNIEEGMGERRKEWGSWVLAWSFGVGIPGLLVFRAGVPIYGARMPPLMGPTYGVLGIGGDA